MKIYQVAKDTVQRHLLATVAPQHELAFGAYTFAANATRFALQSLALILMDGLSLLIYALYYSEINAFSAIHIAVHLLKMGASFGCCLLFSRLIGRAYQPARFFDRNMEMIYPLGYLFAEMLLFAAGPQDLGALVRLLAVLLAISTMPVIRQRRSCLLGLLTCISLYLFLPLFSPYAAYVQQGSLFVSIWCLIFPAGTLISCAVYAGFVNQFMATAEQRKAGREVERLTQRLDTVAEHDILTGLMNRRGFQACVQKEWDGLGGKDMAATVMLLTLDSFKLLNDIQGHAAGDACLVAVSEAISEELAAHACCPARYSGEAFIAVAYDAAHEAVIAVANQLRAKVLGLKIPNPGSDAAPFVTVSIGVASCRVQDLAQHDMLVRAADECLFFAKRRGGNQVVHTQCGEGIFYDIYGQQIDIAARGTSDSTYVHEAFGDINADCVFVYHGTNKDLVLSPAIVALYAFPAVIDHPTLEKMAEYMPIIHEDRPVFLQAMQRAFAQRLPFFAIDINLRTRKKEHKLVSLRMNMTYAEDGSVAMLYGAVLNVKMLLRYSNDVGKYALTNAITLLPNRAKLEMDLEVLLQQDRRRGYLVVFDIKQFREINGVYGHVLGDRVLSEVALRLSRMTRFAGALYHYGVDQFVLLVECMGKATLDSLMDGIREQFAYAPVEMEHTEIKIEFIAVAVAFDERITLQALLVDVDIAIQVSKYDTSVPFSYFSQEDKTAFVQRFTLNKALLRAVDHDMEGFLLNYQPIVDSRTRRVVGAEALLRWQDATGRVIPPDQVIPVLEREYMMPKVERWIFDQACGVCRAWIDEGMDEDIFVNINLSPYSIGRTTLLDEISEALCAYNLQAQNITLEVPETAAVSEIRNTIATLERLREKGFRIAMDDFGSGYSSLGFLPTLPIDEVKIDRSFVLNIENDTTSKDFLQAVVSLAKSMRFMVCVEGIETQEQMTILDETAADYIQGFLFCRPVTADVFAQTYREINGQQA